MSVTSLDKDFENLTMTLIADFNAPVERVWQLWADPRRLEQWWGPPTYPATMEQHELTVGGEVAYYMTSPEGDKYHGRWTFTAINPPTSLAFTDNFADQDGKPVTDMPTMKVTMNLSAQDGGSRMELRTAFDSEDDMKKLTEMGMEEGLTSAVGQMDALLTS